jgi:hypothetical protein
MSEQHSEINSEYLITINVPPSIEESIVDCLLTFETASGFSSFIVNAHDYKNEGFSLAEQVTGRQKKVRFQMYVPEQDLQTLLAKLKGNFTGAGIQYWVLPIVDSGYI